MSLGLAPSFQSVLEMLFPFFYYIVWGVISFSDLVIMQNKSSFTNSSYNNSLTWVCLILLFTQVRSELHVFKILSSPLYLSSLSSNVCVSLKVLFLFLLISLLKFYFISSISFITLLGLNRMFFLFEKLFLDYFNSLQVNLILGNRVCLKRISLINFLVSGSAITLLIHLHLLKEYVIFV